MSDSCYMEICFMREDLEALSKLLGHGGLEFWDDIVDSDERWIKVSMNHANYGFSEGREKAAAEGLVFYGYCGEGGNYASCLFVSFGKEQVEVSEINRWPAARLDDSGNVVDEDVKEGKKYLILHGLAVKYMEGTLNELNTPNSGGQPQEGSV